MSSNAGERTELIDSGNIRLTNVTDNLHYNQLAQVHVTTVSDVTKRQRTDSTLDKFVDLRDMWVDGLIYLTEPEIVSFVALTVQTNNLPPARAWRIIYTADNGSSTQVDGSFYLTTFKFESEEEGYAIYRFHLESTNGVITAT